VFVTIEHRQAAKVIGRAGKIGLDRISSYTAQILDALRAVHELGYVHLDVKPDNVVVDKSYRVVKLIDFGSCLQERQLNDRRRTSNSYFVARFYRAPELMLRYGEWSSSIDVWSLGVTLLELAMQVT
jgi:serine/threonine protein kinase